MMSCEPRLVFTHIGKTAGSSVNAFLEQVSRFRGADMLTVRGPASLYAQRRHFGRVLHLQGLSPRSFDIVAGHIPFATARYYFMPAQFVTVLRDPRWQLISNFCSQPPNKAIHRFNMDRFIPLMRANPNAEWAIDNMQTRMLCNDFRFCAPVTSAMLNDAKRNLQRYYSLVGDADDLPAFLAALARKCGAPGGELPRLNSTGEYQQYVNDEHLHFCEQWSAFDMDLWAWARSNLAERSDAAAGRIVALEPVLPSPGWVERASTQARVAAHGICLRLRGLLSRIQTFVRTSM